MGKKKSAATTKSTAKAVKKAKAAQKIERKEKKKVTKTKGRNDSDDDDDDLEGILEKMRREWEEAHTVTEELVEGPPSRRANATLTACPNGNHLWCIGGEFFSEDGKAYFYNDVFRYTPEKDEWRKFVSPTCPGPRSAHAVVSSPAGRGKIFLFGGEFSSLHQNSFHHYGDFWCFNIPTHSWDRIETKIRPSSRSGHRMAVWKQYIVLFGGFYDPGITTRYLNDLWLFDTQEYKWQQIEFRETDNKPSPRSGFSFLPCADGIVLHGGYCKEYAKGKRPVGVMLDDTWLLKIALPNDSADPATPSTPTAGKTKLPPSAKGGKGGANAISAKWERRKRASDAYAPSLRSGCTMTSWTTKGTGVLFGGVTDEDVNEESLESVFWNDLYGYQLTGKGKWMSLALKRPKAKGKTKATKKQEKQAQRVKDHNDEDEIWNGGDDDDSAAHAKQPQTAAKPSEPVNDVDSDDPSLTLPLPRYNAMLSVLRNTLYIYGGIYERGSREYTLDDFYSLQLDKLDKYTCLKKSDVIIPEGEEESSSDEDDGDEDDEDDSDEDEGEGNEDSEEEEEEEKARKKRDKKREKLRIVDVEEDSEEEEEQAVPEEEDVEEVVEQTRDEKDALRLQANTFMGVAKDNTRSAEDVISTPLPGETLAMFYARSREFWSQKAFEGSDNRGKELRRDAFELAKERYAEYKPILAEVEKILAEAGLDEEEMRRGAAGGPPTAGGVGQSRNRR